jgi:hypothetical protein
VSGQPLLHVYARRLEPGREYCAKLVAEGIGGRKLRYAIYRVGGGRTLEVASRWTCGVGRAAAMSLHFPEPGEYVIAVADEGPCPFEAIASGVWVEVRPLLFTTVIEAAVCVNSPDGSCGPDAADFHSLLAPRRPVPVAAMPVRRVTVDLYALSPPSVRVTAGGSEVAVLEGYFPASADIDAPCHAEMGPVMSPVPLSISPQAVLGTMAVALRAATLTAIASRAISAAGRDPLVALAYTMALPVADAVYLRLVSPVISVPPR